MRRRFQDWLREAHGTQFELVRHFLGRLFESDVFTTPGEWTRVAIGIAAMLVSLAIPLTVVLHFKYSELGRLGLEQRIPGEMESDLMVLVTLASMATVFLAAGLWESLFPVRRDYLALASLPIRPAEIFSAKFGTLCLVFVTYGMLLFGPAAVAFSMGTHGQAGPSPVFLAMVNASAAVFFGIIALQGLLLHLLPGGLFQRVSVWVQALLVTCAFGGFWLLPGLRVSSILGLAAPAVAVLAYVWSYRHHRPLFLENFQQQGRRRRDPIAWILDLSIRDAREQAALLFIWKTLGRSRVHRLAFLAYTGLGIAWALTLTAGDAPDRLWAGVCPLVLAVFMLFGLRHLYSLPVDLPANWLFQIVERAGRSAWLRGVEHFTLWWAMTPVLIVGAAVVASAVEPLVGVAWFAVALPFVAVLFELLFRNWRKMPFTCSYLPGKRPLIFTVGLYVTLIPVLVPFGMLLLGCASNPAGFSALLVVESTAWLWLRNGRLKQWGRMPLAYEELPPNDVDCFNLAAEGTILAQEQFQRVWEEHLRCGT